MKTVEIPGPPKTIPLSRQFHQVDVKTEIQTRIANFRAHQERFNRERQEYFSATLARGSQPPPALNVTHRVDCFRSTISKPVCSPPERTSWSTPRTTAVTSSPSTSGRGSCAVRSPVMPLRSNRRSTTPRYLRALRPHASIPGSRPVLDSRRIGPLSRVDPGAARHRGMISASELGSLASTLEDILRRITAMADDLVGGPDDSMASSLIDVERLLRSGARRLDRIRRDLD